MMNESEGSVDFDAEAQESLLWEEEESSSNNISIIDVKLKLQACILCIRSTFAFTSAAHHHHYASSSSSISASDHISIHISDDHEEGSGTTAALAEIKLQLQREKVSEIVKMKNLELLREFGGVEVVAEALNTHLQNGITIPQQTSPPQQTCQFLLIFSRSFLKSCNSYTVLFLSIAIALSLGFGINEEGTEMGWFNGCVLLVTLLVIVFGTSIRTCWEKWLSIKSQGQGGRILEVKIVRDGEDYIIGEVDVVVGDIVVVKKGDHLPADGLFIGGHDDDALELDDGSTIDHHNHPFMFYGSRIVEGEGRMLVTSIGMDTVWGEMMSRTTNKECNLECCLNRLFLCFYYSGLLISILIMVVLFFRYKAGNLDDERRYRPETKGDPVQLQTFVDALKEIVTGTRGTRVVFTLLSVSLVGVVEAVPLVITVSILTWSHKILAHKAMGMDSFVCVNMARLTTICTDISGLLMEHGFGTHKLYVGEGFVRDVSGMVPQVVDVLRDVIVAPSLLAVESETIADYQEVDVDSLISWAESMLGVDRNLIVQSKKMLQNNLIMEKNGNRGIWYCQGLPDQILSICSHHYDIDGQIREINEEIKRKLECDIGQLLAEDAHVTAYAFKHIQDLSTDSDAYHHPPNDLTFLAMIEKTRMEALRTSVSRLKEERIKIILASGEDIPVLTSIAQKCGLHHNSDDLVLTGDEFRRLGDIERRNQVDKMCIIGNCSPNDVFLLIKCLKEKEQVVALVAHKTVDAPALKLSDIGLTRGGNSSSEIARDCSDITLVDPNSCCFEFLVNAIKSGRCLLENIRKFIQMQLIFTISSSLINFAATVAFGDAPITTIQLFWLNLVVPYLGGLALLTDSNTGSAEESWEKLMTWEMWRNMVVQVCYQTSVLVGFQYKGQHILGTSGGKVKSIIYNAFFLCQMFNMFIARQPRKMNIYSGLFHNSCRFWVALLLFIISQASFVAAEDFFGGGPALTLMEWGGCFLIAVMSLPLHLATKMLFFAIY